MERLGVAHGGHRHPCIEGHETSSACHRECQQVDIGQLPVTLDALRPNGPLVEHGQGILPETVLVTLAEHFQSRRHTSFASVKVVPAVEDDVEVVIDDKDLRIDTFRASGAGGQHVNKTDSAVRITHMPSGIVTTCQNERSQHRNRDVAMHVLRAKLYDLERSRADERLRKEVGVEKKNEWASQIRSYTLAPFRLVKDHRTGHEMGNADRVLDGDLDGFIRSALLAQREDDRTRA